MALSLASLGDYERLGNRRVSFRHRKYEIILRHPPGQRDLDDFHPHDYRIGGRQQKRGTIGWILKDGVEYGHIELTYTLHGHWFMPAPFGGLGEITPFLGQAIDTVINEIQRWGTHKNPREAINTHQMQETVLRDARLQGPYRMDVVPRHRNRGS